MVDGDWKKRREREKVSFARKAAGGGRRTVVDDRRDLLARERRLRVRKRREQDVLDMNPDMMSEGVVVGVCSSLSSVCSPNEREEGKEHTNLRIRKPKLMFPNPQNPQKALPIRRTAIPREPLQILNKVTVGEDSGW